KGGRTACGSYFHHSTGRKHQGSVTTEGRSKPYYPAMCSRSKLFVAGLIVASKLIAGEVPVKVAHGHVILDSVYVNGRGPFTFLMDTGAQSTVITPELARKLGVKPTGRVVVVSASHEATVYSF